jgi:hypothetical protein
MKRVERFEDLVAWQKARILTEAVYRMTRERAFARDIGLSSQVRRAAVSIMANIAEGFERIAQGSFINFCLLQRALVPKFVLIFMQPLMPAILTRIALPKH